MVSRLKQDLASASSVCVACLLHESLLDKIWWWAHKKFQIHLHGPLDPHTFREIFSEANFLDFLVPWTSLEVILNTLEWKRLCKQTVYKISDFYGQSESKHTRLCSEFPHGTTGFRVVSVCFNLGTPDRSIYILFSSKLRNNCPTRPFFRECFKHRARDGA